MPIVNWSRSPAWLSALQQQFGQMLRTPLDSRTGTLRASPDRYPRALVRGSKPRRALSSTEGLEVYNRQYWFRLFTLLQGAFPLLTRLLGHWQLNQYAARFLSEQPPSGWDIDTVALGFELFLPSCLQAEALELERPKRRVPSAALREALALDAGYRRVFRAPDVAAYQPAAADAERLLAGRLRFSPAAALITETWALCALRQRALAAPGESVLTLQARLPAPCHWLLVRKQVSIGLLRLEAREAKLLKFLQHRPVGVALAQLEAECSREELEDLPARTRAWLARSVKLGVWTGVDDPS